MDTELDIDGKVDTELDADDKVDTELDADGKVDADDKVAEVDTETNSEHQGTEDAVRFWQTR